MCILLRRYLSVACLVGILIGVAIGLVNAWGVAVMKAPSLIFTLGTNGVAEKLVTVRLNCANMIGI